MQISLRSTPRWLLFGCCTLLAITEFMYLSTRAARAHAWSEGVQQWQIERSVALEPQNSEYWYRLGNWHLLMDLDSVAALNAYSEAVRQNSHTASPYLDMARASLIAGDRNQLVQALENALRADPTTPSVNWEAANLYLAAGEVDRALPLFRTVSAESPEYRSSALDLSWRATHDVNRMAAFAIPHDAAVYSDFLRLLVVRHETAAADELWQRLPTLCAPIPTKDSFIYLDSLLDQHRVSDAARAWRELATLHPEISSYLAQNGNLVVNPKFEQEILNGGFDWRIRPPDKVSVELAASGESSGSGHGLSVTFEASNTDTAGIVQLIPLEANSPYLLSLDYKTEDLEGAHGIFATVRDAYTGAQLAATDEFLGSTGWQQASTRFNTGSSTALVSLELRHTAGTLIRGKLQIADVRLVKE